MSAVRILVNGKPVKQHYHQNNTYVEGRSGTEYSIEIKNDSFVKKLAVITVDGINVLSGNVQGNEKGLGYIVNGHGTLNVKGTRADQDTVGAFKFCPKDSSYCNEQGLKGNNGVIGVRMYDEVVNFFWQTISNDKPFSVPPNPNFYRVDCISYDNVKSSFTSDSIGSSDNMMFNCKVNEPSINDVMRSKSVTTSNVPKHGLGTEWGSKIEDRVEEVSFNSQDFCSEEFVIYYDTRKNLKDIGISFENKPQVVKHSRPKAFGNYATPPKNWP